MEWEEKVHALSKSNGELRDTGQKYRLMLREELSTIESLKKQIRDLRRHIEIMEGYRDMSPPGDNEEDRLIMAFSRPGCDYLSFFLFWAPLRAHGGPSGAHWVKKYPRNIFFAKMEKYRTKIAGMKKSNFFVRTAFQPNFLLFKKSSPRALGESGAHPRGPGAPWGSYGAHPRGPGVNFLSSGCIPGAQG